MPKCGINGRIPDRINEARRYSEHVHVHIFISSTNIMAYMYLYLLEWDTWVICKAPQYQIIFTVGGTVAFNIKECIVLLTEVIYCLQLFVCVCM